MAPHRVVVGVHQGASASGPLLWSTRYAEQTGALLELVSVWRPSAFDADPAAVRERLHRIYDSIRAQAPAIRLSLAVLPGRPGPVLVERARGSDVLVVGRSGRLPTPLTGATSRYVRRHAECPVLVVAYGGPLVPVDHTPARGSTRPGVPTPGGSSCAARTS